MRGRDAAVEEEVVSELSVDDIPPRRAAPNQAVAVVVGLTRYREKTILTDRGVTIIQRDRDGTRTIVRSDGYVRVVPPSSGGRRR